LALKNYVYLPVGSLFGGFLAVFLVFLLSKTKNGSISNLGLILAGVAVASLFSAFTSCILFLVHPGQLQQIVFWMMGGLSAVSWNYVFPLLFVVLFSFVYIYLFAYALNAMCLSEEIAFHLGLEPDVTKQKLLVIATVITSFCVSIAGVIGFVGLMVPHAVRILIGPDHKFLLPATMISGGIFLLLCDIIARTIVAPTTIPLGIITSMLGGPFFLYILYQYQQGKK
jgi:iron complex transport system permease protein